MRVLLVLGRISNLPTVWSNCLAAWLLAGGGPWNRFALVCLGATLLYTGGMFLNDAMDVSFDRRYRPERPIPSGRISARAVWILSGLWLLAGWAIFVPLGNQPVACASALLVAIIAYDLVHKRTVLAPLLMAFCRFLLYVLAAAAIGDPRNRAVLWCAVALAAYIVGLSYLARSESKPAPATWWPVALLFVPILVACLQRGFALTAALVLAGIQVAWTFCCLFRRASFVPSGVAGLLAGIVLVDALAAAGQGMIAVFLALFVFALCLQRLAPAT